MPACKELLFVEMIVIVLLLQLQLSPDQRCQPLLKNVPKNPSCLLPAVKGHCRARIPMFYFNSQAQRCLSFNYGGCSGNSNRFITLQECEAACPLDPTLGKRFIGAHMHLKVFKNQTFWKKLAIFVKILVQNLEAFSILP